MKDQKLQSYGVLQFPNQDRYDGYVQVRLSAAPNATDYRLLAGTRVSFLMVTWRAMEYISGRMARKLQAASVQLICHKGQLQAFAQQ